MDGESKRSQRLIQHCIRFRLTPNEMATGCLLVSKGEGPFPGVKTVYYEPETSIGMVKPNETSLDHFSSPTIQALERNAKTISMKPGQPERIEFEYTRHGTLCLIGNWHVVLGQMIAPTIRSTRMMEE